MKTLNEMALEAGFTKGELAFMGDNFIRLIELACAEEREACANLVFNSPPSDEYESPLMAVYIAIKARGNT